MSGVVGIGIGDTAFFAALNALGVERTLLMDKLSPVLVTLLAWLTLGEQLQAGQLVGLGLTVAGVVLVVTEGRAVGWGSLCRWSGLGWGVLYAVAQSVGMVISRAALVDSAISPLWSATIRLTAGLLVLSWGLSRHQPSRGWMILRRQPAWLLPLAVTAFLSTYAGLWLQQMALQWAPAGVVQALSSTSPLFALVLVWLTGGPISRRAGLGMLLTLLGCSGLLPLTES
ncbi:MAG: DMT family transporter [Gloeomargarita sp. SKYB31]|nr:DMT family transporter [Gloeomargarita sp. SKYB31]